MGLGEGKIVNGLRFSPLGQGEGGPDLLRDKAEKAGLSAG